MAAAAMPLAGVEVPVIGSDAMKWIEISVPSFSPHSDQPVAPPISRDVASCHVTNGDAPSYLFWRIHLNRPNVLELFEVFAFKGVPEKGLHLVFQDDLSPFAFLCSNESVTGETCMLYVLSITGTAYVLNLRRPFPYLSGSQFPKEDVIEFSVRPLAQFVMVTAAAATSSCLLTGRLDGSIGCYQLGRFHPEDPGFMRELRDDGGIGRLWGLMSRGKVGAVQDMVIGEVSERQMLFVLHSDWSLRIWDLVSHTRTVNQNIYSHELTGTTPSKLCVGGVNCETNSISLAVLHKSALESCAETVTLCNFELIDGDKIALSSEISMKSIHLDQGRLVDMKIGGDKLWILKEDESMLYDLSEHGCTSDNSCTYILQEDFVAEQLFQSSDHTLDELIWTNNSVFSLMKDQIPYFISSIFLRRLLQPGVYQSAALHATLLENKKYLSDHEFQSLSISGLKKEIFMLIESEGAAKNSSLLVQYWKNLCTRFFRYWCQNSAPYGLFIDPSNEVIGLIRKSSFSVFRAVEDSEKLIYATSDGFNDSKISGLADSLDSVGCELLSEVLRSTNYISHQLGRAATSIYYEALISPMISSDDIVFQLLKILETGHLTSMSTDLMSQIGLDATWEKKQIAHRSLRKFSADIFVSLLTLRAKAINWDGVLDIIEKYLQYLHPQESSKEIYSDGIQSINSLLFVQATSQIARVMFESAFDVLLFLGYLANICGQVDLMKDDVARIKLRLIPRTQEILTQWLIIHFLGSTPTTPRIEDFSSRLSSLHIGSKGDKMSFNERLGSAGFTLACLFRLPRSDEGRNLRCIYFPKPHEFKCSVEKFCSMVAWGKPMVESHSSTSPIIEIASHLLTHGQFEAAENLLLILDSYSSKRRESFRAQNEDGDSCACLHLLGYCFLVRAHNDLHGVMKEQKIREAVRYFFRAAAGQGTQSLQNLSFQTGFNYTDEMRSTAVWRLHYYQWAMQIFEQYGMSEGACQFSLAAIDQVEEVLGPEDGNDDGDHNESPTTIRGRLWANVFKFSLDLRNYQDAYCAIVSNPDEDSKHICLRRFVIVLCEQGATKLLCDGTLPFVGLIEKVEKELFWKAERSDIYAKPNLYRLLYALEAYHNNWKKAAAYMYRYSMRLKSEAAADLKHHFSPFQERLYGLSTAINALQLVDHAYAWIDSRLCSFSGDHSTPDKRARNALTGYSAAGAPPNPTSSQFLLDVETLEKEYVLASAQYQLTTVNNKYKICEKEAPENLVSILIESCLYDMAFTIILKFWKGSALLRELEQAFVTISQHCCSDGSCPSLAEGSQRLNKFLLPSSENEIFKDGKVDSSFVVHQLKGQWETLELYLEKYRKLHSRLPVVVAETLLHTNPEIELPLWLVHMFKGGRGATPWGMAGQDPDPATLFRLYVNYGRHAEAVNLLLEYLESFASSRPADAASRKRMSAVWFPYSSIERLWCQLEELQSAGHMFEQCEKHKNVLRGSLLNHLKQLKVDSEDAVASGLC